MELGEYDITDEFAVNEVYVLRVPNLATLVPEHDIMSPTVIKKVKTVHAGSAAPVVVRARQRRDVFCFSGFVSGTCVWTLPPSARLVGSRHTVQARLVYFA